MQKSDKEGQIPLKRGPRNSNSYFTSYPIFSLATDGQGLVITGGGGGGRAYGVLNFLQAHVAILTGKNNRFLALETIATLDTGTDAPMALDFNAAQGGLWACALGANCMLFKFNDDSLSFEPLIRWKSETNGNDMHITNFVKMYFQANRNQLFALTGGEDKQIRLWKIAQENGPGTRISEIILIKESSYHNAEVIDGDWQPSGQHFLSCGKDGTVRIWSTYTQEQVAVIQPRSIDSKLANETLSIRSAFFVGSDIVVLCHHPRGPAFLMLFSLANPTVPISAVKVSKTITPSMGINLARDKLVVSHAGGEKDIFSIPSLRLLHRSNKHSHEMPPGKSIFALEDVVVSASPDFSLNFFDPKTSSGFGGYLRTLLVLIFVILLILVIGVALLAPEQAKTFILSRHAEL